MKIAVVGAGAMGSIFGARFHQAGHETVLVDVVAVACRHDQRGGRRPSSAATTRRSPACPLRPIRLRSARSTSSCSSQSATTPRRLPRTRVLSSGPDTVVASLQNGWGNGDVLAAAYPPGQVVVGVTYNSGLLQGPGRVLHPAEQPTLVGSFSDGR